MTRQPLCADAARERGDQLAGTASPATAWVLLDNPDPWPHAIANDPIFTSAGGAALMAAANRHGTRMLFIRRTGRRHRADGQSRTLAVVHQGLGLAWWHPWVGEADLAAAAELVLALTGDSPAAAAAALAEEDTGWHSRDEPVLLVCAHAQHDVCCAVRGRAVARPIAEEWPDFTWECSHLGGDRFAGNVLVVPDGVQYGGLDADNAVACLRAHFADRDLPVAHLRGVCGLAPHVNVALREVLADGLGRSDVEVSDEHQLGPDSWLVRVRVRGSGVETVVEVTRSSGEPTFLTCHASHPAPPVQWTTSVRAGVDPRG